MDDADLSSVQIDHRSVTANVQLLFTLKTYLDSLTAQNVASSNSQRKLIDNVQQRLFKYRDLLDSKQQRQLQQSTVEAQSAGPSTALAVGSDSVARNANRSEPEVDYITLNEANIVVEEILEHLEDIRRDINKYRHYTTNIYKKLNLNLEKVVLSVAESPSMKKTNGIYKWKIANLDKLRRQLEDGADLEPFSFDNCSLPSERFQTDEGYEFRMRLFMNGVPRTDSYKNYISLFVQLCKGEMDEILEFPFNGQITFILFDQASLNDQRKTPKHYVRHFKSGNTPSFQKPVDEFNQDNGVMKFISFQQFYANLTFADDGKSPIFVRDNCMFLEARVKCASK